MKSDKEIILGLVGDIHNLLGVNDEKNDTLLLDTSRVKAALDFAKSEIQKSRIDKK